MPGNIFISYRREDTAGYAGRLYDRLKAAFPGRVFIDVGEIRPGADFVKAIEQHVAGCAALVALIGSNWTTHDRLQDSADFVRLEISSALKRDISIIPVLVGAAKLPAATTLPEDILPLLRRQTISISDEDWDHGCERLIQALQAVLGPARKRSKPVLRWSLGVAAAVVVVLAAVLFWKARNPASPATTTQAAPANMPETTRAAADYDKSVAKGYDNATKVMDNIANQIGGAGKAPGPTITAISPSNARPGAAVFVIGTNFGVMSEATVKFGSATAKVVSGGGAGDQAGLTVIVPPIKPGVAPVVVSAGGVDSAPVDFTVNSH